MKLHPSISFDRVEAAMEEDLNLGFCISCGEERDECELDAQEYECHSCGELKVYGAQEILIAML